MKTGRNDPCPCGSGKKFKVCCLGKQAPPAPPAQPADPRKGPRNTAACHEAGHIVLDLIFGIPVGFAEITGAGGYTDSQNTPWYEADPTPERAMRCALAALAGPASEALLTNTKPSQVMGCGQGDIEQAATAIAIAKGRGKKKGLLLLDQAMWKSLAKGTDTVNGILERCQDIVNVLADLLIERGRLEGSEIDSLAQRSPEIAALRAEVAGRCFAKKGADL